jgi:hypothetical protein
MEKVLVMFVSKHSKQYPNWSSGKVNVNEINQTLEMISQVFFCIAVLKKE